MSENYRIIYDTHPHLHDLQKDLAKQITEYRKDKISIIELGCGDGYTTQLILDNCRDLALVALDKESKMLSNAKSNLATHKNISACTFVESDALSYLQTIKSDSIDVIASAMTLHNINCEERLLVHKEIFRVLKKNGLFINLDKFADNLRDHQNKLQKRLSDYFEYFIARNDLDHLKDWVLHEVDDASSKRLMVQTEVKIELENIGFNNINFTPLVAMECILTTNK